MGKDNQKWKATGREALHWLKLDGDRVRCTLCPRNCETSPGQSGFCGVRKNADGLLETLNYGKSVPMTQESIETEAVFHYAPGEAILSLGNIGCMMRCDFCQNWVTSQASLATDKDVSYITPEEVVEYALAHNIRVLSWTYNDPVVWQEFVLDTARLAKAKGLKNLYKSAFYIGEKAISELLELMDIFSISIKSMDADFYPPVTKGELKPILDGVLQVYAAKKAGKKVHLELSNLCVTGRNDNFTDSMKVADWMLKQLDNEVPLHYVRFHPDYLYTNVERTSISFLEEARIKAMRAGLKYVYVGNVHGTPSANTYCPECNDLVVERYGLSAVSRLTKGACPSCGYHIPIVMPWGDDKKSQAISIPNGLNSVVHKFRGPIRSCHVEQISPQNIYYQFEDETGRALGAPGSSACLRFMISSPYEKAEQVRFYFHGEAPKIFEVYDRAHFPVLEADKTNKASENVPPAPFETGK